jgi:hypothetical protein
MARAWTRGCLFRGAGHRRPRRGRPATPLRPKTVGARPAGRRPQRSGRRRHVTPPQGPPARRAQRPGPARQMPRTRHRARNAAASTSLGGLSFGLALLIRRGSLRVANSMTSASRSMASRTNGSSSRCRCGRFVGRLDADTGCRGELALARATVRRTASMVLSNRPGPRAAHGRVRRLRGTVNAEAHRLRVCS